jgi:hypothetical protein
LLGPQQNLEVPSAFAANDDDLIFTIIETIDVVLEPNYLNTLIKFSTKNTIMKICLAIITSKE